MTLHRLFTATLAPIALLGLTLPAMAEVVVRQQTVRPLPGELDAVLMVNDNNPCLLYTSPSPRDQRGSRMPSSA